MIIDALSLLLTFQNFLFMVMGTAIGIVLGAAPGIGPTLSLVLVLPFAFWLKPVSSLLLMGSVYGGCIYGGSITAILLNIPGEPGNAATCFDGFALNQKGEARLALNIAVSSSAMGGIFGTICLIMFSPILVKISLLFGPSEFFWVAIFGLSAIAAVAKGSAIKGLIAGGFGVLLSFVGHDPFIGVYRFTLGIKYLQDGIPLIPVLIGLFAISQVFEMAEENEVEDISKLDLNVKKLKGNIFNGILTPFRYKVTLIRSLIIGVILGTIPAAGVSIANFLAYAEAKRSSKDPDSFGHGNPEGIVAPESANNAVVSSSLIPALTIGVPGTASAAIIMSALIMQGLRPGPNLFEENGAIAYAFFIGLIIINIIMLIMGWAGSFIFAKISDLPKNILVPIIIILSCVGSFSMQYRIEDVIVTVIFGFFGYVMRKFNYPPVAIVLALILGSMVEKGFLRALMLSGGNYATFFIRPISVVIILLTVATLFFSSRGWTLSKK